ncbi:MAG TPA: hypothetical protein VI341_12180, partial [Actinomycetota bacterium]
SGPAGFDLRFRRSTAKGDFGERTTWLQATTLNGSTLMGKPGSTYCIEAHGLDEVGNTGVWSPESCTAVPLDDRSLLAKGSWIRAPGGVFEDSTSTAKARGARLVVKEARVRRFAIMARTCPECGTVRVSWRGKVLGTIDLSAPEQDGVIFSMGTKGKARSGTLVLEVRSKGRPVTIDAVGITRV